MQGSWTQLLNPVSGSREEPPGLLRLLDSQTFGAMQRVVVRKDAEEEEVEVTEGGGGGA